MVHPTVRDRHPGRRFSRPWPADRRGRPGAPPSRWTTPTTGLVGVCAVVGEWVATATSMEVTTPALNSAPAAAIRVRVCMQ
jgi:hypothetical protein